MIPSVGFESAVQDQFLIFDMEEGWKWNISNYIIKSDVCIKLKYIRISLEIYQHISYHAESKKGRN